VNRKFFLHIYIFIAFLSIPTIVFAKDKIFTVVIDPGHGGHDAGAVGPTMKEKDLNLSVALKLGKMILDKHQDVKVIYTRKTDVFIGLDERAEIANKNKADLFISIHANSVERKSRSYGRVVGTETYTLGLARTEENLEVAMRENSVILLEDDYLQKYEGFDPNSSESYIIFEFMQNKHLEQSVSFASEIQKAFSAENRIDRGVRQAGLLVLRKTSMPSVLIELGFISTRQEEQFMKSTAGQNKLVKAIYSAFSKYKNAYDKRSGALGTITTDKSQPKATEKEEVKTPVSQKIELENKQLTAIPEDLENQGGPAVYKVQILTSSRKLAPNDKQLKGYKNVDFYIDSGAYKYTVGATTRKEEINSLWNKVRKDFRGAFIIEMKDGKRIK